MLTAKIDTETLARGLHKMAALVNESGVDATARWGVQLCRELARQTQPWGVSGTAYKKQVGAIMEDALNVVLVVKGNVGPRNKRGLHTAEAVNDWIEINRTRRRSRTAKLSHQDRKICTESVFKAAMAIRIKRALLAKAGWIASGLEIAASQHGLDQIHISADYIPRASKLARERQGNIGRGAMDKTPNNPTATLDNLLGHSRSNYVLSFSAIDRAITWAGKATLIRYEKILGRKLNA